ncbi:MAG: FimV/HubP family polar landmark protein [Pseudomonadales bacterium]|nr:FimV/HubP family polar landmark protein [Pseudomonadales bacterium]
MIQRVTLIFVTCAAVLFTSSGYSLGLGELELESSLNQRFQAEIELTNVRGLEIEEILPNLASQQDFDRIGVERGYILVDLRFKVVRKDGGKLFVLISSSKPIVEPFLNFLVEVLWPNGRILREYTVLLDPPVFGDGIAEPIAETLVQDRQVVAERGQVPATPNADISSRPSANAPRTQSETASVSQTASIDRAASEGEVNSRDYGLTGPGDTLWKIALKVRPNNSVTVQQTMLALKNANPNAFINNNINLLKAGHVLRIPNAEQIQTQSVAAAVAEVRVQNEEFDAYRNGGLAQLDASKRQSDSGNTGASSNDGELKLLATNKSSDDTAGDGSSAANQALQSDLAVAEEDLDRARRANSELNVRMEDLQGQLDTLTEILKLKDDQLTALRAEVQKMQASSNAVQPNQQMPDKGGSLFTSPVFLGVLMLILVIVVVAVLFLVRKRRAEQNTDDEFEQEQTETIEQDADLQETEEVEAGIEEVDEDVAPETTDVIGEVEIYIAYGRFPQAITFLQNAIEAEPARTDIQLKLLEVFVQTEDSVAFNLQFEQLKLLGDSDATLEAEALQQKIPGAAEDSAMSMDATVISMDPIDEPIDLDDEEEFSFDLDDLGSETEDDSLSLEDDEFGLDLELDGDEDELDLDLDLDLDSETTLDQGTVELQQSLVDTQEDDNSLDLTDAVDIGEELNLEDDDDELVLDLAEDLSDADDFSLDLDDDDEMSLDLDDDDEISLDLDDDDEISLDLDGDDEISLELDDDGAISLDLDDDDEFSLDLDEDGAISLDLDDEELDIDLESELELDDDGAFSLDLDDDELNLDDDDNKLDLARAYIDMGDSAGARGLLEEVLKVGTEAEILEANELLEKII